ncbi:hypothetical protein [Bacillus sp. FJAT-52991]|uniref:Uncharacterized protein n=1 Tax=Bacillus kandeliae TaxID=3129297 RepID=A0ABZ2N894_9BACI
MTQVTFRKTIVGFYNVSPAGSNAFINLRPDQFRKLFPDVSAKAHYGCGTINSELADELFNGDVMEVYGA